MTFNGLITTIHNGLRDVYGEPPRRASDDVIAGLVGTILSQNTSDINSERALASLRGEFPSWEEVLDADASDVEDAIRMGGLAKQKSETIHRALNSIHSKSGAMDPHFLDLMDNDEAMDFLTGINGVGQKTAACVLMFDLERDVLPVDTHVRRVTQRLGLVPEGTSANRTQELLEDLVIPTDRYAAHVLFIQHGRTTCIARNPKCASCVISDCCHYASTYFEGDVSSAS